MHQSDEQNLWCDQPANGMPWLASIANILIGYVHLKQTQTQNGKFQLFCTDGFSHPSIKSKVIALCLDCQKMKYMISVSTNTKGIKQTNNETLFIWIIRHKSDVGSCCAAD